MLAPLRFAAAFPQTCLQHIRDKVGSWPNPFAALRATLLDGPERAPPKGCSFLALLPSALQHARTLDILPGTYYCASSFVSLPLLFSPHSFCWLSLHLHLHLHLHTRH
jgi:hypothetical protein